MPVLIQLLNKSWRVPLCVPCCFPNKLLVYALSCLVLVPSPHPYRTIWLIDMKYAPHILGMFHPSVPSPWGWYGWTFCSTSATLGPHSITSPATLLLWILFMYKLCLPQPYNSQWYMVQPHVACVSCYTSQKMASWTSTPLVSIVWPSESRDRPALLWQ